MAPASIPAQPPLPPPTAPRTRGTPDKSVDAAADATAPSDGSTCAATKPQRNEKRPASRHGERITTHLRKSTASRNEVVKGVMKKNEKTFGFIQAEDGTDMFVIPSACANFGHQLPAVGTKVIFRRVIDAKTNKIRADAVSQVATEIQDNAQQSHPEITEATQWKHGDKRRCEEARSGTPDWFTHAKKPKPPSKPATNVWSHLQSGIGGRPIGASPWLYPPDI